MRLVRQRSPRQGWRHSRATTGAALALALCLVAVHSTPVLAAGSSSAHAFAGCDHSCGMARAACTSTARNSCAATTSTAASSAPGEAAMRIELDPETGGWRLAPMGLERSREAEAAMMLNQSDAGLVSESLPGGGVKIDLQGRFQSYSMVSVGLDGRLQSGCVESPFAVEAWLSGYVSNPAPPAFPVK